MHIVFIEDNLHEIWNPVFWGKKNKKNGISLSSAELDERVVKIKIVPGIDQSDK